MTSHVLLTDIDNTLYDWIDYFAPCFRAMVHAIAYSTHLEEDDIYAQFKDVYARFEVAEYRDAIQELDVCRSADKAMQARIIRAGFVAFSRARRRHLRAYPSVPATLQCLQTQGVTIVGVTNSWVADALGRLNSLGLSKYFDGLVAWDGAGPLGGQPNNRIVRSSIKTIIPIPSSHRKPNTGAYEVALATCGIDPASTVWAIGDSLTNDLAPAKTLGAYTIWARYGHDFKKTNYDTIVRITHWNLAKIKSAYDTASVEPDAVVDDFGQLCRIIPKIQPSLFTESDSCIPFHVSRDSRPE